MTTTNFPFALITGHGSRYMKAKDQPITSWKIVKIGRETAQRIYQLPVKPASRWQSDPYWTTDQVLLKRFATREEAEAFLDGAKARLDAELAECKAAQDAAQAAQERNHAAQRALQQATQALWAEEAA